MSVAMTNCGALRLGVERQRGYRYAEHDPDTGAPWPAMPAVMLELARARRGRRGFRGLHAGRLPRQPLRARCAADAASRQGRARLRASRSCPSRSACRPCSCSAGLKRKERPLRLDARARRRRRLGRAEPAALSRRGAAEARAASVRRSARINLTLAPRELTCSLAKALGARRARSRLRARIAALSASLAVPHARSPERAAAAHADVVLVEATVADAGRGERIGRRRVHVVRR